MNNAEEANAELISLSKYSTFWPRFWAIWFDSYIVLPFISIGKYLSMVVGGNNASHAYDLFSPCIIYLYYIVMHSLFGKTFGKMLFSLKVFSKDEGKVSWAKAALRESIPLLLTFIGCLIFMDVNDSKKIAGSVTVEFGGTTDFSKYVFFAIYMIWEIAVFISMLKDEKKRSLQDKIAGTVVIKSNDIKISVVILVVLLGLFSKQIMLFINESILRINS